MGWLREKVFPDALELFINPLDLLPCRGTLRVIQCYRLRTTQPPLGTVHNRSDHLQIADEFGGGSGRNFPLPLRFEKQRGVVQNTFADPGRSAPPGGVQLPGLAAIAVMLGEDGGHPLAVFEALPRYRHQKLHGRLRRDLAFPHPLLDAFRQQFH